MLAIMGNLENYKNKVQLESGFKDVCWQVHNRLTNDESIEANPKLMAQVKADYSFSLNIPPASVGQYIQIAKWTGKLWDLIWKVLQGKFNANPDKEAAQKGKKGKGKKDKGPKAPNSAAMFVRMGNVPQDLLCDWLEQYLDQEITSGEFTTNCTRYKAEQRIKLEVTKLLHASGSLQARHMNVFQEVISKDGKSKKRKYVSKKAITLESGHCWQDVAEQHPQFTSHSFTAMWTPTFEHLLKKNEPPATFKSSVMDMVKSSRKKRVHKHDTN
jgi:hypothetical protein